MRLLQMNKYCNNKQKRYSVEKDWSEPCDKRAQKRVLEEDNKVFVVKIFFDPIDQPLGRVNNILVVMAKNIGDTVPTLKGVIV